MLMKNIADENADLSMACIVYRLNKKLGPHSGHREEGFQEC